MSKRGAKPGGKSRGQRFPISVKGYVDQDYTDRLSPDEKEWLAKFNNRYYGADFRDDAEHEWSTEERRERYRAKNSANADVYFKLESQDALDYVDAKPDEGAPLELESRPSQDMETPTPEYLNTAAYKRALKKYRATLPAHPRAKPPEPTPEAARLKRRVERHAKKYRFKAPKIPRD